VPSYRIGALLSVTGPLSAADMTLVRMLQFAADNINAASSSSSTTTAGVLGRRVEVVIANARSSIDGAVVAAESLLSRGIKTIFGGIGSETRRALAAVLDEYDNENNDGNMPLLYHPSFSEGMECNGHIIYGGSLPNQLITPAMKWLQRKYYSKQWILLGEISSYNSSRLLHQIARAELVMAGGDDIVVDEIYIGNLTQMTNGISVMDVAGAITRIATVLPSGGFIFSSLTGAIPLTSTFFASLYNVGMSPPTYTVLSSNIDESSANLIGRQYLVGHYTAATYHHSINSSGNDAFKLGFHNRYGDVISIGNTAVTMASLFTLWSDSVGNAASFNNTIMRPFMYDHMITIAGDEWTMTSNHHFSMPQRMAIFNNATSSILSTVVYTRTALVTPDVWSQSLSISRGLTCDWSITQSLIPIGYTPASFPFEAVYVGILHSVTGTLAVSEQSVIDATLLAIDEINLSGGVLSRQIIPILANGASTPAIFATKATQLLTNNKISTIFGCWSSSSRKAVLPVIEANDVLLWYPVQYEGQECNAHVMYTGQTPHQQIEPALQWLLHRSSTLLAEKFTSISTVMTTSQSTSTFHSASLPSSSPKNEEKIKGSSSSPSLSRVRRPLGSITAATPLRNHRIASMTVKPEERVQSSSSSASRMETSASTSLDTPSETLFATSWAATSKFFLIGSE
jgi:ABC-type branched-subunit amino acid transport system substrate-binding protein